MREVGTVLMTGASGLVGRALSVALRERGWQVRALHRRKGQDDGFYWDPVGGVLAPEALAGVSSVVHLAGESVAQRWTPEVKQRILNSRVAGTQLLVQRVLEQGLEVDFISASGLNYYGCRCGPGQTENSSMGTGFLAEVCKAWESALRPLSDRGLRVVKLRTGMVLSAEGGALKKLLPIFRKGVGGRVGSGYQSLSWVALPDLVGMYVEALENSRLVGPVNAVAPQPVTNRVFTRALGRVVGRPAFLPVPAAAVRAVYGEMADETVLADVAAYPKVLQFENFEWQLPELRQALSYLLSK